MELRILVYFYYWYFNTRSWEYFCSILNAKYLSMWCSIYTWFSYVFQHCGDLMLNVISCSNFLRNLCSAVILNLGLVGFRLLITRWNFIDFQVFQTGLKACCSVQTADCQRCKWEKIMMVTIGKSSHDTEEMTKTCWLCFSGRGWVSDAARPVFCRRWKLQLRFTLTQLQETLWLGLFEVLTSS